MENLKHETDDEYEDEEFPCVSHNLIGPRTPEILHLHIRHLFHVLDSP